MPLAAPYGRARQEMTMQRSDGHGSGRYRVKDDAIAKIRARREELGLSQSALGQLLLYTTEASGQRAVAHIESGKSGIEGIMNAASALGIPLESVIEWTSERTA